MLGIDNYDIVFNFEDQDEVGAILKGFILGQRGELHRLKRTYNTGHLYKEMD